MGMESRGETPRLRLAPNAAPSPEQAPWSAPDLFEENKEHFDRIQQSIHSVYPGATIQTWSEIAEFLSKKDTAHEIGKGISLLYGDRDRERISDMADFETRIKFVKEKRDRSEGRDELKQAA